MLEGWGLKYGFTVILRKPGGISSNPRDGDLESVAVGARDDPGLPAATAPGDSLDLAHCLPGDAHLAKRNFDLAVFDFDVALGLDAEDGDHLPWQGKPTHAGRGYSGWQSLG